MEEWAQLFQPYPLGPGQHWETEYSFPGLLKAALGKPVIPDLKPKGLDSTREASHETGCTASLACDSKPRLALERPAMKEGWRFHGQASQRLASCG